MDEREVERAKSGEDNPLIQPDLPEEKEQPNMSVRGVKFPSFLKAFTPFKRLPHPSQQVLEVNVIELRYAQKPPLTPSHIQLFRNAQYTASLFSLFKTYTEVNTWRTRKMT